jgi:thiol-disulfide isomerase/thioredoxin
MHHYLNRAMTRNATYNLIRTGFLVTICFLNGFILKAQQKSFFSGMSQTDIIKWQKAIGDEWFNAHIDSMIKVGDKMPNIPLGETINNYTDKKSLYDFKGKLVILDFWNTGCKSCIVAWPHLSSLQKEFADQIQIILVNKEETKDQITERLEKLKKTKAAVSIVARKDVKGGFDGGIQIPTNLFSIIGKRKDLDRIFPLRGVPFHAWIDGTGIVRLAGGPENTNEEKIKEYIAGKNFDFICGFDNVPIYQPQVPYHQLLDRPVKPGVYNSIITEYNKYVIGNSNVRIAKQYADDIKGSIRRTFINVELFDLYFFKAFAKHLSFQINNDNLILGPNTNSANGICSTDFSIFLVSDTLRYTSQFIRLKGYYTNVKDNVVTKPSICYEQIAPSKVNEEERDKLMLTDLNEYLKKLYHVDVYVEKRTVPCFALVRTSKRDKLTANKDSSMSKKIIIENGKRIVMFNRFTSLSGVIRSSLANSPVEKLLNESNGLRLFFVNETGFLNDHCIEIKLPEEINSLGELKNALRDYDLDIVERNREFNFIVFKEKKLR